MIGQALVGVNIRGKRKEKKQDYIKIFWSLTIVNLVWQNLWENHNISDL